MFKFIRNFFHSLFSSTPSSISSKRFIAIEGFQLIVLAVIMDIFYKKTLTEYMWTGILLFIAACLGLNTFLSSKAMDIKENVSTDLIEKEPEPDTAQDAKDVLQADKPA